MTIIHTSIISHAEAVRDEACSICALGPALTASRLADGIALLRLELASLSALQRNLEGQERDPRLLLGLEPSALGGWWRE